MSILEELAIAGKHMRDTQKEERMRMWSKYAHRGDDVISHPAIEAEKRFDELLSLLTRSGKANASPKSA